MLPSQVYLQSHRISVVEGTPVSMAHHAWLLEGQRRSCVENGERGSRIRDIPVKSNGLPEEEKILFPEAFALKVSGESR